MWWRRRSKANALLVALLDGAVLKVHRTLDGEKMHKLYGAGSTVTAIDERLVRYLEQKQLIQSNMKFPAATYLLTEQGVAVAKALHATAADPLVARTTIVS